LRSFVITLYTWELIIIETKETYAWNKRLPLNKNRNEKDRAIAKVYKIIACFLKGWRGTIL
jgi:hypothetical protein